MDDDDKFTLSDEVWMLGDRFYIKATATFNDTVVTAYAREALDKKGMDASQITGSTSSYARKYALNGLFAIDDTKDADATNTHDKEEVATKKLTRKDYQNKNKADKENGVDPF